ADRTILHLMGPKYLIIDSLVIKSTSADYGFGVMIDDMTASCTISNCTIDLTAVTSTSSFNSYGMAFSGSLNSTPTTVSVSNMLIEKNTIIGGAQGFRTEGTFATDNIFR